MRGEKLQEEKTSNDFIHKLIVEDFEAGKRKTDDQKKDDSLMGKMTHERVCNSCLLFHVYLHICVLVALSLSRSKMYT